MKKEKKSGSFAKLLEALAKGVSVCLCHQDWLFMLAVVINLLPTVTAFVDTAQGP